MLLAGSKITGDWCVWEGGEEVGEGAGLYFTPCTSLIIMEGGWLICYALYFFNNYGRGMAGGGGGR